MNVLERKKLKFRSFTVSEMYSLRVSQFFCEMMKNLRSLKNKFYGYKKKLMQFLKWVQSRVGFNFTPTYGDI